MRSDSESHSGAPIACPACGTEGSGKFCSECGSTLRPGRCAHCSAGLVAGSKFCSECGTPVGPVARARPTGWVTTPRLVAALAGVAFVAVLTAQFVSRLPTESDVSPPPVAAGVGPPGAAPDISSMSPRTRASRLYDRVMRLHEERKADSVAFFLPMALASYAAIPDIDLDGRYDMARIAMVGGSIDVARAQADTMLRRDSTHLLALLLGADLARARNDVATANRLEAKLVASEVRERARNLPEYEAHGREIERALERLKPGTRQD